VVSHAVIAVAISRMCAFTITQRREEIKKDRQGKT
jgi:hypothetical protein